MKRGREFTFMGRAMSGSSVCSGKMILESPLCTDYHRGFLCTSNYRSIGTYSTPPAGLGYIPAAVCVYMYTPTCEEAGGCMGPSKAYLACCWLACLTGRSSSQIEMWEMDITALCIPHAGRVQGRGQPPCSRTGPFAEMGAKKQVRQKNCL